MAQGKFSAAVEGWEKKCEVRKAAVVHGTLRELADVLGDKTPKVTGNLSNSRAVTTGGPPTIDWKTRRFKDPSDEINNAVAGVEVGETAWVGLRAPYAHKIEPKYAMLRLTAQLFRQIVDRVAGVVRGKG